MDMFYGHTPIECSIRITSRHYVHDVQRFEKYGTVPSLFSGPLPSGQSSRPDPEDFPEDMANAVDEILRLENSKYGSPLDIYSQDESEDGDDGDAPDGEYEDLSPSEEFNRKLDEFIKLLTSLSEENEDDSIVFETRGTLDRTVRDGVETIEVSYTEDESMDGTETVLRFAPSRPRSATIVHTGGVISNLICDEGVRHISVYETPIMPFEIAVYTKKCRGWLSLAGGKLDLDYILELRGADLQRTQLTIEVTPVGRM